MTHRFQTYLVALAALLFLSTSAVAAGPSSAAVIGTVDQQTGQAWLQKERLRTTFADGGPIEHLLVRQFQDGYHLLRIGKSRTGGCRTESIPLMHSVNRLIAKGVSWYTICSSPNCSGFCTPTKSACPCYGDGALDALDSDLFDVENNDPDLEPVGQCNFGIDVSGMGYHVIVID